MVSQQVADDIRLIRFMQRMHLSYDEALNTPADVFERAFLIWDLDAKRAKLKAVINS